MKTYKNLYDKFISEDNIRLAIKNSAKGKKKRKDVKIALENEDVFVEQVKQYATNFFVFKHKPKEIYDGISRKKRTIIVPKYIEQVVHHMICQVMKPIFTKSMYEHTYASIPKRGGTKGMKVIKKWISNGGLNVKYCVKLDIKKYFDNIPHDKLLHKLKHVIKDDKFMNILTILISSTEKGLPLGFYTSQWFANWYLNGLDHFIKEALRVKHYIRYMDDMVFFCRTKKECKNIIFSVKTYLQLLGLKLKNNYQYFRFDYKRKNKSFGRALDFMGYKFYRNRVTLRKSILCKMRRKALKILKKQYPTVYDCKQMMSYIGWLKLTNTYRYYEKYLKGIINFGLMKQKISNVSKKERGVI